MPRQWERRRIGLRAFVRSSGFYSKHPWALAQDAADVWAEIWPDVGPRIEHVLATGEATWDEGLLLFLERSRFAKETYHTFSYRPVHDDHGAIAGMFCVVTEETDRVIAARRLDLLQRLGGQLAATQTTDDVWRALERSLADDARDLPFTLTYVLQSDDEGSPWRPPRPCPVITCWHGPRSNLATRCGTSGR